MIMPTSNPSHHHQPRPTDPRSYVRSIPLPVPSAQGLKMQVSPQCTAIEPASGGCFVMLVISLATWHHLMSRLLLNCCEYL